MMVAVVTVVALMALLVWIDARCLADLARTPDADLRYFTRNTWALIIVMSFPIGPMLYLLYARDPRRYS
ncbi:hypothetical protein [Micromonospora globispora]|uniref:hypothetical protein n=1 Tax=Micromonospora globispora TaxID=1450148 RepID=UPI000F4E59DF|nr:hypothetical protein [Micromonospora globispora]